MSYIFCELPFLVGTLGFGSIDYPLAVQEFLRFSNLTLACCMCERMTVMKEAPLAHPLTPSPSSLLPKSVIVIPTSALPPLFIFN